MEDGEEDNCTATNLNSQHSAELRDVVTRVITSQGGDAAALFPRFNKLVSLLFIFRN